MKPTEDRIIVKPIDNPEVTKGGLIIPYMAVGAPTLGEIIAIGPGKAYHPVTGNLIPVEGLKEGDLVMFPAQAGYDWTDKEQKFKTIRASDIIMYDPEYGKS